MYVLLEDPLNNTSSPYRGKNYALLLGMITKAAVRAYRSELRISGDRYTLNWLEKFIHRNDMEGGPNLKASSGVTSSAVGVGVGVLVLVFDVVIVGVKCWCWC